MRVVPFHLFWSSISCSTCLTYLAIFKPFCSSKALKYVVVSTLVLPMLFAHLLIFIKVSVSSSAVSKLKIHQKFKEMFITTDYTRNCLNHISQISDDRKTHSLALSTYDCFNSLICCFSCIFRLSVQLSCKKTLSVLQPFHNCAC